MNQIIIVIIVIIVIIIIIIIIIIIMCQVIKKMVLHCKIYTISEFRASWDDVAPLSK